VGKAVCNVEKGLSKFFYLPTDTQNYMKIAVGTFVTGAVICQLVATVQERLLCQGGQRKHKRKEEQKS
jgi:hypothetical protein